MITLFKDPFSNPFESIFGNYDYSNKPKTLVDKDSNGYKIKMSVPGLTKDNLKIKIKDGVLKVSYEKDEENENYQFIENFSKSYSLDNEIIESKIKAEVKNGILTIELPFQEKKMIEKLIPIE